MVTPMLYALFHIQYKLWMQAHSWMLIVHSISTLSHCFLSQRYLGNLPSSPWSALKSKPPWQWHGHLQWHHNSMNFCSIQFHALHFSQGGLFRVLPPLIMKPFQYLSQSFYPTLHTIAVLLQSMLSALGGLHVIKWLHQSTVSCLTRLRASKLSYHFLVSFILISCPNLWSDLQNRIVPTTFEYAYGSNVYSFATTLSVTYKLPIEILSYWHNVWRSKHMYAYFVCMYVEFGYKDVIPQYIGTHAQCFKCTTVSHLWCEVAQIEWIYECYSKYQNTIWNDTVPFLHLLTVLFLCYKSCYRATEGLVCWQHAIGWWWPHAPTCGH